MSCDSQGYQRSYTMSHSVACSLPGKHAEVLGVLGRRHVEDGSPLMLGEASQQVLCHPLVQWRVPTGEQLCTGVVHTGAGKGHVITAGCGLKQPIDVNYAKMENIEGLTASRS